MYQYQGQEGSSDAQAHGQAGYPGYAHDPYQQQQQQQQYQQQQYQNATHEELLIQIQYLERELEKVCYIYLIVPLPNKVL